jgi:1,4-dihydroxy-2-naphthoate octaprenyltransferase
MYAIASMAVMLGITQRWDPTLYRIFYLFGAMLNVPWLALGSIALFNKKPLSYGALGVVLALSVFGLLRVIGAHVTDTITASSAAGARIKNVFGGYQIPSGKDVWLNEPGVRSLAIYYSTIAYLVVVGIASYSSFTHGGRKPPQDRVRGNLLISIGVTIVAIGSTALVRIGRGSVFSVTLAIGVATMFAGFLYASRAPKPSPPPEDAAEAA